MLSNLRQSFSGNRLPVLLISLLFFILPLAYWPELFEAASLPRFFLIGVGGSIILLLWAIFNQDHQFTWHPGFILIIGFLSWAAISTSWSPDPATSLIDISQLFSMIVLAFLAMQMSRYPVFLRYLVPAVLIGSALTSAIGIGQYFDINPPGLRANQNSNPATFINPNHAAVYFDFIPWLAFFAILHYRPHALRWLAAGSLGLCLAYISINTSRGSWLALLVSGLVFLGLVVLKPEIRVWIGSRITQRYKAITIALLIPFIVLLFPTFQTELKATGDQWDTSLLQAKADTTSNKLRLALYVNSLPVIIDHPLTGLGYGGFRTGFQPYVSAVLPNNSHTEDVVWKELHSDPLQYFVELGLPGGLLAIAIFIILFRGGWKTLTTSQLTDESFFLLGIWLGIIAGGAHAVVDFPLRLPTSAAMFWLFSGVLLGQDNASRSVSLRQSQRRSSRLIVLSISIIGLVFSLPFYTAYLRANHDLYNAFLNLKRDNCVAAARASEQGLEKFNFDYVVYNIHARVYSFCSFPPELKLTAMNRVVAADPSSMRARLTRAFLYNEAGRPELAIPEFEHIATILPHRPSAYAGLGEAAELQNETNKAIHYYLAALKRKPDYKYAQNQLIKIELDSQK